MSQLAARQSGRVSRAQLERLGVSNAGLARWLREGYLYRVHPRVYAVGHCAPTTEGDLAAALLYAGPGAALGGATALWWLDLIDRQPRTIDVITPNRRVSRPGLRVDDRKDPNRTWHRGVPVAPVALALLEYAVSAPHDRVRRVLAEADYRHLLDVDAVYALLGRGRPGSAKLRAALTRHQPRLALTRSVLEEHFLALCESARLPLPECNSVVEGLTVDMLWRAPRLIVELDGHDAHDTRAQIERDRRRELRLRAAGFVVLRYTWDQVTREPELVLADLRLALARARSQ